MCSLQMKFNSCFFTLGNTLKYYKINSQQCCIRELFLQARKTNVIEKSDGRCYGAATIASSTLPGALSKQQAKDLAVRLTAIERDVLMSALLACQSKKEKAEYEGKYNLFYLILSNKD